MQEETEISLTFENVGNVRAAACACDFSHCHKIGYKQRLVPWTPAGNISR
jgi:hypothetical protein